MDQVSGMGVARPRTFRTMGSIINPHHPEAAQVQLRFALISTARTCWASLSSTPLT